MIKAYKTPNKCTLSTKNVLLEGGYYPYFLKKNKEKHSNNKAFHDYSLRTPRIFKILSLYLCEMFKLITNFQTCLHIVHMM